MNRTILDELNVAQHEAVTCTTGPMLIIAGAGTGKTRVITSRILHLLLNEKIPAKNILALTFTEKATNEMVTRTDEAMPLSYEGVTIKTFHGFCDMILRESGHEIGLDSGYKLHDQAQQWLFLKKNLFAMELDYFRPLGNPNKFIHTLISHFSRLKDEDITPEIYIKYAEGRVAGLENRDGSEDAKDRMNNAVDSGTIDDGSDAAKEDALKTLELARAYATYQDLMVKNNNLDFGDLQFYALRLLEKRASVMAKYQELFKYILVDEFQDTNFAQNKLVMQLAAKYGNITVVGDDDQSIYKWRGASLTNILSFEKSFPECRKVVLTENYRSSQDILDLSYHVIRKNNPGRLEHQQNLDKRLIAKKGTDGKKVEIRHHKHYLEETAIILKQIKALISTGAEYKDIAVLVRANQHAGSFIEAFKSADIPFSVRDTSNLTRYEEIKDLVAMLRFVSKPQDDVAYFRLLSMPLFGIGMAAVLDTVNKAKKAGFEPLFYFIGKILKNTGAVAVLPGMGVDESPFRALNELSEYLLDFSREHSISRILGEFLDKSGYYKDLISSESQQNAEKIQHIAQFIEIAHEFEGLGQEASVKLFLEYLNSLEAAHGLNPINTDSDENAVSVLTVHSAKGLEFNYVFVPCMVAQRFPSTKRSEALPIPDALLEEDIPEEDMHIQEERRLFYVACTRAGKQLFLSYSDTYEGRKKWKVSPFIGEALESENVTEIDLSNTDNAAMEKGRIDERVHAGLLGMVNCDEDSEMVKKISTLPVVNINQLSYSQIDTFKTCPLKYKFRYLFNIPTPSPHAANFGSGVHNAINLFYKSVKEGADATLELLLDYYERGWVSGGYESKAHEMARKKAGIEMMRNFYDEEMKAGFKVPAFMENGFRLKVGGIAFTGRIDRIDRLEDGTYEVIDYKTGTSKRDINLSKDLQLSLYALACRDVLKINVSKLSLYYLEDAVKASTTRSDEDIELLKDTLNEISSEMKGSGFCPTPGFHCSYCEYRVVCHAAE